MNKLLSIPMRMLCTIVFCAFAFSYLYFYQADVMFVAQQAASEGQTHYEALPGAILITLALKLLQIGIFSVTKLYKRFYVLTYFPSFLCLAILTNVCPDQQGIFEFGAWKWLAPLMLVLFMFVAWVAHDNQSLEPDLRHEGPSSQLIWISLLAMGTMSVATALVGNGEENYHMRAHMENIVFHQTRQLTETVDTMGENAPVVDEAAINKKLMNKDLPGFARHLARHFSVSQPMPHVYAEALTLNTRFSNNPQVYWKSKAMDAQFDEFVRMAALARESVDVKAAFKKKYSESYWYYYYYVL